MWLRVLDLMLSLWLVMLCRMLDLWRSVWSLSSLGLRGRRWRLVELLQLWRRRRWLPLWDWLWLP